MADENEVTNAVRIQDAIDKTRERIEHIQKQLNEAQESLDLGDEKEAMKIICLRPLANVRVSAERIVANLTEWREWWTDFGFLED